MTNWITTSDLDFSIDNNTSEVPKRVELENDEAEMYSVLFNKEIGAPVEVRKPLRNCLRKFVDNGLLEKNYYKFVMLCHQATKENFDSVEKNGLQVINNQSDVSLICADKKGEWEVVCTLDRELISEFYKHKNFGGGKIIGTTISNSTRTYTPSSSTSVSVSFDWSKGKMKTNTEEDS